MLVLGSVKKNGCVGWAKDCTGWQLVGLFQNSGESLLQRVECLREYVVCFTRTSAQLSFKDDSENSNSIIVRFQGQVKPSTANTQRTFTNDASGTYIAKFDESTLRLFISSVRKTHDLQGSFATLPNFYQTKHVWTPSRFELKTRSENDFKKTEASGCEKAAKWEEVSEIFGSSEAHE